LREHLEAVHKSTGRHVPELDVPDLPVACRGAWDVFLELHARRGGGFGPAPIDEARLCGWQQLHGVRLTPWEIEAVSLVDTAWLEAASEEQKK
jgi:hypothetical protein